MKKKNLFVSLLLLFICGSSALAGNRLSNEGYVGNVGLSVTPQVGLGVEVTSSHGYSFGNGLWMGGGLGISMASAYDSIYLPIYTEAKYTFMKDKKVSPFLDCKLGFMTNFDDLYTLLSPGFGVDINRFSVFALYNAWSGLRTFNLGCAFNF